MTQKKTIVIVAGGTGGHVFPALTLARYSQQQSDTVYVVTDNRGVRFWGDYTPDFLCHVHRTYWPFGRLAYPFSLAFQIIRCLIWLVKIKPNVIIGFGGYPSFPCVWAGQLLKIPTFLHEGNAFLGKANRMLAKKATKIGLSFLSPGVSDPRYQVVGMPVRPDICALSEMPYEASGDKFTLLVLGGSQGAKIFTQLIPVAIALLPFDLQKRLVVIQQCRESVVKETEAAYRMIPCKKVVKSFLDSMPLYYQNAHLVIGRSGASTLAELALAGRPALLIPFSHAKEGDQTHNATQFVAQNAAWMMQERTLTPKALATFLENVMQNPELLIEKSQNMRKLAKVNATQDLYNLLG